MTTEKDNSVMGDRFQNDMYVFMGSTKSAIEGIKESMERQETRIDELNTKLDDMSTKVANRPSFDRVKEQIRDHAEKCEGAKPRRILPDTLQGWFALIGALVVIIGAVYTAFISAATPKIQSECRKVVTDMIKPEEGLKIKHDSDN